MRDGYLNTTTTTTTTTGFEEYEARLALAAATREKESAAYLRKLELRLALERRKERRRRGGTSFAESLRHAADAEFAAVVAGVGAREKGHRDNEFDRQRGHDGCRRHLSVSDSGGYQHIRAGQDADEQDDDEKSGRLSLLGASVRSDGASPSSPVTAWDCLSRCCVIT